MADIEPSIVEVSDDDLDTDEEIELLSETESDYESETDDPDYIPETESSSDDEEEEPPKKNPSLIYNGCY